MDEHAFPPTGFAVACHGCSLQLKCLVVCQVLFGKINLHKKGQDKTSVLKLHKITIKSNKNAKVEIPSMLIKIIYVYMEFFPIKLIIFLTWDFVQVMK